MPVQVVGKKEVGSQQVHWKYGDLDTMRRSIEGVPSR